MDIQDLAQVARLLENAGIRFLRADDIYFYIEDPGCVVRSFQTFFEYAWTILVFITGILLAGWAWAMLRGSKNAQLASIANNLRSLLLIFGTIAAVPVFINTLYDGDLIGHGCKEVKIPTEKIQQLLDMRKEQLNRGNRDDLYEEFDIYDSGLSYYGEDSSTTSTPETEGAQPIPSEPTPTATEPAPSNPDSNTTPVSARASGNDVIYVTPDNTQYRHVGGTRAWRNNNPGNIRMSSFSRQAGAIGEAGGFAVFPDERTGMRAVKRLLLGDSYKNLTIADAISRYAPQIENDTAAYQRRLAQLTGLSINRRISELNDTELEKVANAIRTIEGWRPGQIEMI